MKSTYEGQLRFRAFLGDRELWITESTCRPASCRWEASARDGSVSVFGKTLDSLIEELVFDEEGSHDWPLEEDSAKITLIAND